MSNTDTEIEVSEDGVITLDFEGDSPSEKPIVEKTTIEEKQPTPRVSRKADIAFKAAEEAAAALAQAVKTAESSAAEAKAEASRRAAAEATAVAERNRAEANARLASQREQEVRTYREQAESSTLRVIESGIETAMREVEAYKEQYARAFEAGEAAKVADAMSKLSRASASLDRLESEKIYFETNAARRAAEVRSEPVPVVSTLPPFEQYISGFPNPDAQRWLRAHPECAPPTAMDAQGNIIYVGGNAVKNARMMLGHNLAKDQGIIEGSPDYFRVIEETVGYRQSAEQQASVAAAAKEPVSSAAQVTEAGGTDGRRQTPQRQAAAPSAPVTRDPPDNRGQPQNRSVRLTPQEQEIAIMAAAPIETKLPDGRVQRESDEAFKRRAFEIYAKNKLEIQNEFRNGTRYNRDIMG
jgi:hypothetical protein